MSDRVEGLGVAGGTWGLRLSRVLIRLAGSVVPRARRGAWLDQWDAELIHRWQKQQRQPARRIVAWSFGAFAHAWHLVKTEFTMDTILQDLRFGLRSLRRTPGLIIIAVLSLGIGIGANTTIFSAVDVFMLRPLPYRDADRMLTVFTTNAERGWTEVSVSVPDFRDLRDRSTLLDVAAFNPVDVGIAAGEEPERVQGAQVSANYFAVFGISPMLGRTFTRDEEAFGSHRVALISEGLWHRRFAADSSLPGRTAVVDGESYTILGVVPSSFRYQSPVDIWVPLPRTGNERRGSRFLDVTARMREDTSTEQVNAELASIGRQLAEEYPDDDAGNGFRAMSLRRWMYDEGYRVGSIVSSAAVAFVLLIACANVANLMLARGAARDREVAVRGALGAHRTRILRQFLTESLLVAALGGIVGLGLAVYGIRAFIAILPPQMTGVDQIALNPRVLVFTGAITLITGVLFGLVPAWKSAQSDVTDALRDGVRAGSGRGAQRIRGFLVVAEVAMAVALLISSAILVQALRSLMTQDMGMDTRDVLTFRVTLPSATYPDTSAVHAFHEELQRALATLPGVRDVGATSVLPDRGGGATLYTIPGQERGDAPIERITSFRSVMPGYFDAFDIPLLAGRSLTAADRVGAPGALVVNEAMADQYWPGESAIGRELDFSSTRRTIVGLVANARDDGPDEPPEPMLFLAALQRLPRSLSWVVEVDGPPEALAEPARAAVAAIDPTLPVYEMMTMDAVIREETATDAIMPKIMTTLAMIALLLAVGGVYGVISYSVAQRRQELGIRLALGASKRRLRSMVVRQGMQLAFIGVVVGVGLAAVMTRALAMFLFGVNPFDPVTFTLTSTVLLAVAAAATYVPARRATRVNPIVALRAQ